MATRAMGLPVSVCPVPPNSQASYKVESLKGQGAKLLAEFKTCDCRVMIVPHTCEKLSAVKP